ncbi:GtrA family protein [Streptomyces fragilis]|uniref:GtrA family protein n=1 Tax=Streptomyces fragilis TaxID=67301 RepID=UPI0035587A0A
MTAPGVTRRELAGFAAAGLAAYLVDLAVFTALLGPGGLPPLPAKGLAFLAACAVAFTGNAVGTYGGRGRATATAPAPAPGSASASAAASAPASASARPGPGERLRQAAVFTVVNAAGAAVQLGCLAVSHYGLGHTSHRADLIAGAGVGMLLGTVVRFWGTRTLVFRDRPEEAGAVGDGNRNGVVGWTG